VSVSSPTGLNWRAVCSVAAALHAHAALAAATANEFEEIIVSASRLERSLKTTPRSVSVITAEEIRSSTASTVVELLRREAGVNLQTFFSSDKFATLDLRGMGATASSNVLVLVDGVRLNTDDLAGPDLATISLSQIERVEIVRGGNSVRYGNGAVGGVINLITKRSHDGAPQATLFARRGEYDSDDYRLHGSGEWGPLALTIDATDADSDGYRDNDFIDKQTGAVRLDTLLFDDALEISLRATQHEDSYGLPGPLGLSELKRSSRARRHSDRPFDRGSTTDSRYVAEGRWTTAALGEFTASGTYRDRENPFVIGFNPNGLLVDQENQIDIAARTYNVGYQRDFALFGQDHQVSLGVDWNRANYLRRENGQTVVGSSTRRTGELRERGYFADLLLGAGHGITFNVGYRGSRFASGNKDQRLQRTCEIAIETTLVTIQTPFGPFTLPLDLPVERNCVTGFNLQRQNRLVAHNDAFTFGATWEITPTFTAFVSANKSFRSPNVDELLFATSTLGPQAGREVDAGVRVTPLPWIEVSAAVFHLTIEDEIFFSQDPVTGQSLNRNLEGETERTGGELEVRAQPLTKVVVRGSLGYVRPQMETGADIPLVPRITGNLGLDWTVFERVKLGLSATYVGARFDGNDVSNRQFPDLPAYTLFDTGISYRHGKVEVFGGINNLFNELYSTVAYSSTVYPMPERHAYVGIRVDL